MASWIIYSYVWIIWFGWMQLSCSWRLHHQLYSAPFCDRQNHQFVSRFAWCSWNMLLLKLLGLIYSLMDGFVAIIEPFQKPMPLQITQKTRINCVQLLHSFTVLHCVFSSLSGGSKRFFASNSSFTCSTFAIAQCRLQIMAHCWFGKSRGRLPQPENSLITLHFPNWRFKSSRHPVVFNPGSESCLQRVAVFVSSLVYTIWSHTLADKIQPIDLQIYPQTLQSLLSISS